MSPTSTIRKGILPAALAWLQPASAAGPGRHEKDVVYATVDGKKLALDLHMPAGIARPPLVVYVHGGAWRAGSKEVWMVEGGSPNLLFKRGITKASIPVGSELRVEGFQARDRGKRAVGRTITFADGKALFFDSTAIPDSAR